MKIWNRAGLLCLISLASIFHQTNGYDSRDPRGNITIRWDVVTPTPDGYVVRGPSSVSTAEIFPIYP